MIENIAYSYRYICTYKALGYDVIITPLTVKAGQLLDARVGTGYSIYPNLVISAVTDSKRETLRHG